MDAQKWKHTIAFETECNFLETLNKAHPPVKFTMET